MTFQSLDRRYNCSLRVAAGELLILESLESLQLIPDALGALCQALSTAESPGNKLECPGRPAPGSLGGLGRAAEATNQPTFVCPAAISRSPLALDQPENYAGSAICQSSLMIKEVKVTITTMQIAESPDPLLLSRTLPAIADSREHHDLIPG